MRSRAAWIAAVLLIPLFFMTACRTDLPPSAPEETEPPAAPETLSQEDDTMTESLFPAVSADRTFNRMTFRYSADTPSLLTVAYTVQEEETEDAFYLEAGEDMTFSALIKPYLKRRSAKNLRFVSLDSLTSEETNTRIDAVELESIPVYSRDVYTIEGSRFAVGIKLSWGGGISSITDTKNPVDGMNSLINNADTGRLIQQSYYGTPGNGEYTPGSFNNSNWVYNPVQGGNMYNLPSRLIDIRVSEDSVTIKAQPQDWSSRKFLTPSYMENTYTVTDEYIRIDNRFVDFSGWAHDVRSQEVPAFYTVSYLDTFVRYHGARSWTGDALSYERDLPFWGDPATHDQCVFPRQTGQTETWCAWIKETDDYGVGIYVPNADVLLAGRHAYNDSKNPADGATNYVAPLRSFAITSFKPFTYSSMITAGSVEEIRAVFEANRDFAANEGFGK